MSQDMVAVVIVLATLAASAFVMALLAWAYPKLANQKQGYPLEAEIEAALLPYVYQGILAAFKVSEKALDELGRRLSGADKKALAAAVYALLPNKINGYDLMLVKALVPPERFAQLVQDAFDMGMAAYWKNDSYFDNLFNKWLESNPPPAKTPQD